eukprot:1151376-Pelagomonas_calceolata.AAC.4
MSILSWTRTTSSKLHNKTISAYSLYALPVFFCTVLYTLHWGTSHQQSCLGTHTPYPCRAVSKSTSHPGITPQQCCPRNSLRACPAQPR